MTPFDSINRGISIGGWISNYKRARFLPEDAILDITVGDREHFENYMTRWDFQNIRSFGVDHIRIPFLLLELPEHPLRLQQVLPRGRRYAPSALS